MELSLSLLLLGFPIAFLLGWIASRIDIRQLRLENRHSPKAYFKGLNFLLNEQPDQAIDAFIEAVQLDPDTSELHFALGNLFRKRGEYDRAVRVHEHLIGRADLSLADRNRAYFALATDFLRAGILDRAETVFQTLVDTHDYDHPSELALLSIYERTRDWPRANEIAKRLTDKGHSGFDTRRSHYLCEQAAALFKTDPQQAQHYLEQAAHIAPEADRPKVDLAKLTASSDPPLAFALMHDLISHRRPGATLIATLFADTAIELHTETSALTLLTECYAHTHSLDILEGMVRLLSTAPQVSNHPDPIQAAFLEHAQSQHSLIAAQRWLESESIRANTIAPPIQQAIAMATRTLRKYRCASCGFETQNHHWNCPGCQSWDSYPPRRIEEL